MSNEKSSQIRLLADPRGGPPPTDPFYPDKSLLRFSLLDTLRLAVAIAAGWSVVSFIVSIFVVLAERPVVVELFKVIFPGFGVSGGAFLLGFVWGFIYGFIFGLAVSLVYNGLVRRKVLEEDSWEKYY